MFMVLSICRTNSKRIAIQFITKIRSWIMGGSTDDSNEKCPDQLHQSFITNGLAGIMATLELCSIVKLYG